MIEGIDYYPKKNKNNARLKWQILLLVLILAIGYWYFDNEQDSKTSELIQIIISQPQPIANPTPISFKPSANRNIKQKIPEIVENLDEVVQMQTTK